LGSIHTTPEEFENAALFLRLGLPSTLIRYENGVFENAPQAGGIWKRRLTFGFSCGQENILEKEFFENTAVTIIRCDFPDWVFRKHISKMIGDCCVFKFLRRSVDAKHLMHFQIETAVFKFIQRSVDERQSKWDMATDPSRAFRSQVSFKISGKGIESSVEKTKATGTFTHSS